MLKKIIKQEQITPLYKQANYCTFANDKIVFP